MPKALFTDTSKCIGCRGCQVACKQWHGLPAEKTQFWGSYENPKALTAFTWRRVKFVEARGNGRVRWSFMSDNCKHCTDASCLAVCPTGAIFRRASGAVDINQNLCNGCRYCVSACPFGVISFNAETGRVNKCIFCPERVENGLAPACATTCPTGAISFGERGDLMAKAKARLEEVKKGGFPEARIYGETELSGLHSFYLLTRPPEAYGLPEKPKYAIASVFPDSAWSVAGALAIGVGAVVGFRERGRAAREEG
ncbi:MAG: 4Fe-4S dicluster domain-containing protein [candidate division NC10 bacterium]|nr:4Fe-4S dicluster domain-containing protein [candidate division NC10 bacterium]